MFTSRSHQSLVNHFFQIFKEQDNRSTDSAATPFAGITPQPYHDSHQR
jgi:hypothetical protein